MFGSFPKLGCLFAGGPHNEDLEYIGIYIGVPLLRELRFEFGVRG